MKPRSSLKLLGLFTLLWFVTMPTPAFGQWFDFWYDEYYYDEYVVVEESWWEPVTEVSRGFPIGGCSVNINVDD